MRMPGRTLRILAAVTLAATGGCIRAAKEGLGVAIGAKGSYRLVPGSAELGTEGLANYTNFELRSLTDATEGLAPRELWGYLPSEFQKELDSKKLPRQARGKTLLARGKVIYYEDSSMAGNIFGPLEEVVARVEFVDKATGRVLAEALCVGRTGETVNRGIQKKAEGLAKAIVRWIHDHYPPRE